MLHVNISVLVFGHEPNYIPIPDVSLQLTQTGISASELIRLTVVKQISAMTAAKNQPESIAQSVQHQYLHPDDVEQMQAEGKIALAKPLTTSTPVINVEQEAAKAITAFRNKRFKIFIDGEEVQDVDQLCQLHNDSNIKFLRLIPLVGG
ncbi:hypothetical protein Q4519_19945 [Motilimonas sp. 1_MG-2023]|uniref:hypothetical protein n=1 Tax=Motilimonas sp. 1_MG-2023 TaxID=3062672 RepID=UPI0026E1A08F|nr:hypothetical protein [Motilimonas sp. 1_MG-2023]MDO6527952.1 hypothetical protein [Motilimonas sp. 1_MG-2023]